jgi:hypothetical protein
MIESSKHNSKGKGGEYENMSNSERDRARSLRFTQGRPAEISAGFDRAVSRFQGFFDKKVLGSTRESLDTQNIQTDNLRYEIHKRTTGVWVEKRLPDGTVSRMDTSDIVHVYSIGANNQEQLVERKRIKDNPQGFSDAPRR